MAKYQPSKYYADDKDLHDILSSPKITIKRLLYLARRRGIFLSEESPHEEIVNYMSKLPFAWHQLQEVMVELEREDRAGKLTICKVSTSGDLEQFRAAAEKLKERRGESLAENYKITQSKEGRVEVRVAYSEPDFQKNRLIQRRQREVVLEVEKRADEFEVRSTQSERAEAILGEILTLLVPPEANEKPLRKTIELSGVTNHTHRTHFFVNLMSGMQGFRLREVKNLKVDRMVPEGGGGEEDQEADQEKIELKALVRRVALTGENILISPQYQQLARDGFFISRSVWISVQTEGEGHLFEFEAEFKDAQNASNFAYQIRGVYEKDNDGEICQSRTPVSSSEKDSLKLRLETAAYDSVNAVARLLDAETSEP